MSNFRGRLLELSLFVFITVLFCGLSVSATESCDHNYIVVESHSATCDAGGGTTYQCTECSHTYIGDVEEKLPHTWETLSKTSPTCTASGSLTRRCKVCQTEETTSNGAAKGHNFAPQAVKAPTCSEEGYTYRICNDCNEVEIDEGSYTEKIAHTYEMHIITEPTCQQEGYAEYTCTVCSESYRESVAIVNHDTTKEVTPPTHTEKGYTTYTCRFCGWTKLDDPTEPIPYDMEYTVEAPTCIESGLRIGICRDGCLHTDTEVLPATGHSFEQGDSEGWAIVREATELLDGLEQRVCAHCGLTESRSIAYVVPEPEPVRTFSPALIICFVFALALLLGVMIVVLLIILEHAGHKNTRKYALLTAVDRTLAEQKEIP